MRTALLGKTINEIEEIVTSLGGQARQAIDIANWLYKKNDLNIESITTIPLVLRNKIKAQFTSGKYNPLQVKESSDGTMKYLFENKDDQQFEAVFMPGDKRNTVCISSQSGCRMGCEFCLTAKVGYKGNLSALDIINQYYSLPKQISASRIVIMGMGEPFDNFYEVKKAIKILTSQWGANFGAANITISSVGLLEPLKEFIEKPFCNLAISLNNPFSHEREKIMPIERSNPLARVVELIRNNPFHKPLRVSFEYVAIGGLNTTNKHATAIADLLNGINCHLNIIPWNRHYGVSFNSPTDIELKSFIDCLNENKILTTVRHSRGQDIGAACGQMAGQLLTDN